MNDDYRESLKQQVEKSKDMYQTKAYANPEFGELAMAVVRLIEGSDYGRTIAESELILRSDHRDLLDELTDDSFDGVGMQFMNIAHQYLGRFGKVSLTPYSSGLNTKSALVRFEPNTDGDKND